MDAERTAAPTEMEREVLRLREALTALESELETLRESELRYRTLVESAKDFIFIIDSHGVVEYVNEFGASALHMRPDEVVGRPISVLFPANSSRQAERVALVLATGKPLYVETVTDFPGGSVCLDTWLVPIANQSGQFDRVLGVSRDTTQRKRAVDELEYRIAFEETIASISRQFISVPIERLDAVIRDGLRVLGEFLGADCGSIRLTTSQDPRADEVYVWPENGREPCGIELSLESHPRVNRSGVRVESVDVEPLKKDRKGGAAPVRGKSLLVVSLDYAGDQVGVLSFTSMPANARWSLQTESLLTVAGEVFATALARKRMEEERGRMATQLARAEQLDSIGILAGGIAHDFNNILAAVMGNVSLAQLEIESSRSESARTRLREANKALERARGLTQQLLTFATGGSPVKNVVALGSTVEEAASFAARGSHLRPVFDLQDDLWCVEADTGQIAQVVHNLVINAAHASPDGGTVEVVASNVELSPEGHVPLPPGDYVRITVADRGVGIPEEHLQKIFVPYFTTKEAGTGLGLATSYNIVRKHAGLITVESKLGEGSRFHVYLPAMAVSPTATAGRSSDELRFGKGRVLLVDDDEAVRQGTAAMLERLGYEPMSTSSGEEAVAVYRQSLSIGEPFCAIIMDLTMPGGIGGVETIRRIRSFDPQAAAIVSSGYSDAPVMADHSSYGFRGVLEKPYGLQALGDALHKLLSS